MPFFFVLRWTAAEFARTYSQPILPLIVHCEIKSHFIEIKIENCLFMANSSTNME